MWDEREETFTLIKPKRFLYWHTLNTSTTSFSTYPQGEPLLWTPAPLFSAGSQTSVPSAVWASHKSGFCPLRTYRLLLIKNERLSRLLLNWSVVKFHLPLAQQQHLVKTPSDASTESSTYFFLNCFSTKQQHEFLWAHHVVEDHGMPSELGGEGSGPALAANRPPLAVRKSETAAWDQAAVAGYKQLGQEHDC